MTSSAVCRAGQLGSASVFELDVAEHDTAGHRTCQEVMREAEFDRAGLVQSGQLTFVEPDAECPEIVLELPKRPGSDDRRSHRGVEQCPCECYPRRCGVHLG